MPEVVKRYTGIGTAGFQVQKSDGSIIAVPWTVFNFDFAKAQETENILGYNAGKHAAKDVFESTTNYTLTLSTEFITSQIMAVGQGELFRPDPGDTGYMRTAYYTIPANGQVSVPGLLAAGINTTAVAIEGGGGIPLTAVAGAPADTSEVQVADGQLTFDTGREGDVAFVTWTVVPTSGEIVGGPGGGNDKVQNFNFSGELYENSGVGGFIQIPSLSLTSPPTVNFSGGKPSFELQLEAQSVAGWDEPFVIGRNMVWPS